MTGSGIVSRSRLTRERRKRGGDLRQLSAEQGETLSRAMGAVEQMRLIIKGILARKAAR